MKRSFNLLLVILTIAVAAVASFLAFNQLNQPDTHVEAATPHQTAIPHVTIIYSPTPTRIALTTTPNATSTPTPLPLATATSTALSLPTLQQGWTWHQSVSGFSFAYPAHWQLRATISLSPTMLNQLCCLVVASMGDYPKNNGNPPQSIWIEIQQTTEVRDGGESISLGAQKLQGRRFIQDINYPCSVAWCPVRSIVIFFEAGHRKWYMFGTFNRPQESVDKNVEIFYQFLSKLRFTDPE